MSTPAALTHELFDDAALFPPAAVPLADALAAHRTRALGERAFLVGPLVLLASQVPQVRADFEPTDHFGLAVVADAGLAELAAAVDVLADDPWADVDQVEIAVPAEFDLAEVTAALLDELPFTVPTYLELPWRAPPAALTDALDVVAADGAERVKLRTGGTKPGSVPSSSVLGEFLHGVASRRVGFKLTAGMHRALPHVDPATGDRQHGFLNTLAATAAAIDGGSTVDVVDLLDMSDAQPLIAVLRSSDLVALRRIFRSIGSCSIAEPYDDLLALKLVEGD